MWSMYLVILAQLLCGGWVVPVESAEIRVSRLIRHTLPSELESGMFGSPVNGGCSSVSGAKSEICNGTSVLNDDNIPVLSGIQDAPQSSWANNLFTMRRQGTDRIVVSLEVPIVQNRVELTVFNCPERGIYAPRVAVYTADDVRIVGPQDSPGLSVIANETLPNISCEYLLKFCVQINVANPNLNLVFPYEDNSSFVFLGEVTFLNDLNNPQCGPPELITMTITPEPSTGDPATDNSGSTPIPTTTDTSASTTDPSPSNNPQPSPGNQNSTIAAVVIVVLFLFLILIIALVILIFFLMKRRRKQETDRVHQLQNVVMETEEEEKQNQRYTYVDGPNDYYASADRPPQNGVDGPGDYYASVDKPPQNGDGGPGDYYASVDKPPQNGDGGPSDYCASVDKSPQNGVKVAASEGAITDMFYSNPDEIKNDTYSHLRDGPKKVLTQVNSGVSDDQYSKLNCSQTDPNAGPSPDLPVDEGTMYAVPDKKKQSENTPAVPEKSSELVEYLDIKEAQLREPILQNTPEYSEIESSNKRSGSVGPVTLSNLDFLSGMSSNPLYHTTDIRPLHMMPTSTVPQSQPDTGVLEVNAIYAEPLPPPSTHELEWDPDQNIYESIYSEPLNPSLFMQNREPTDVEELRPYTSIYTVPVVPSTDKPLSVSIKSIKEIKHLGDGNFGQVVLAQTVGLTPKDLRLGGDAPYTLVAVKKLKPSASNRNRQLFDKEISFMSRLNHPNVIRLLGVCAEGATPFIMMEYMTNGDLNQYLNGFHSIGDGISDNEKSISLSTLIYMSTQITSAMQYLASQNFVHRDLATRNCLIGSKDTIKISDFGMSRSLYESQYYVISGHAILPIRWMATECFFGKFSAKTDVWAFGVTMWEIFTLAKDQPYSHLEDREVVADVVKGPNRTLLKRPTECPESMYEIMQKCWVHDASQRPTFDELFNLLSKN